MLGYVREFLAGADYSSRFTQRHSRITEINDCALPQREELFSIYTYAQTYNAARYFFTDKKTNPSVKGQRAEFYAFKAKRSSLAGTKWNMIAFHSVKFTGAIIAHRSASAHSVSVVVIAAWVYTPILDSPTADYAPERRNFLPGIPEVNNAKP